MKSKLLAVLAAVFLLGMTGCSSSDDSTAKDTKVLEQELAGLWWQEYECADFTEAGVPFSRAILAIKASPDHTGCLYLGVFDETSDEPLAVYGGPEDAGFSWQLLDDGKVQLTDLATSVSKTISRASNGSYGEGMTDISKTNVTFSNGSITVNNGNHTGQLEKANAEKEADIQEKLSTLSPDRQQFEAGLSKMLADAQKYIKTDPTMRGVKLLTEFVDQLKIKAVWPQIGKILAGMFSRTDLMTHWTLEGDEGAEPRFALANSNLGYKDENTSTMFNASTALSNTELVFTTGKDTADYVTTHDGAFTLSCKNTTSGAVTKVKMKFNGASDGVGIFFFRLLGLPIAIQFPHMIDLELLRSETGNDADLETVMTGQVALESMEGKRFISLKKSEWKLTLFTEAKKADRFEIPTLTLIHHADHKVETAAALAINDVTIEDIKIYNFANPYSDEEIEQLSDLRDIAPIWKGCYTLLKAFNSRTDKIETTLMGDLLFDIDVLDAGQCLRAAGNALKLRNQKPSKETMDQWTDLLNKSCTFTVTQKSTGVKAEGKFITDVIDGDNMPSVALRFNGESDFRVLHDRMNATDRQNYENMLRGYDEPFDAINALLKAFQDKGVEMKESNPFK